MGAVIRLLMFFIWAGVVPAGMGFFTCSFLELEDRRPHVLITTGYLTAFGVFELLGLPVLFGTELGNFNLLVTLYAVVSVAMAVAGFIRIHRKGGLAKTPFVGFLKSGDWKSKKKLRELDPQTVGFWIAFLCLLFFEMYMAYTRASYDGDDAYYVAQSLQAWQTGTMYHYIPYTGVTTRLDGRHAMAMIPMWIAAVARLCNTHPTIVTHSMIPLVFLPLADVSVYSLVKALLYEKDSKKRTKRMIPAFMLTMALIQIFGNVSIYTPETFLLMRTWQGKTVFANIMVPLGFYCLLVSAHRTQEGGSMRLPVGMMLLVNVASGFCTAMAPFFAAFLFLAGSIFISIAYRDRKVFLRTVLCCIPNLVYALILFWIMLPVLLSGGVL